ncbi:MAG: glycosyltransferase family 2 protein, partial [Armatimonadota bacterium]
MDKPIVSVLIVNWNTKWHLRRCLHSLMCSASKFSFEIIVVDNASTDGSAEMVQHEFPQVKLIANKFN